MDRGYHTVWHCRLYLSPVIGEHSQISLSHIQCQLYADDTQILLDHSRLIDPHLALAEALCTHSG